jgi:hypothetical protein
VGFLGYWCKMMRALTRFFCNDVSPQTYYFSTKTPTLVPLWEDALVFWNRICNWYIENRYRTPRDFALPEWTVEINSLTITRSRSPVLRYGTIQLVLSQSRARTQRRPLALIKKEN